MKQRISIAFFFILCSFLGRTQEKWTTCEWSEFENSFKTINEQFSVPNYSIDLKYSSFKGHNSSQPFETSKGYYFKKGKTIQTYLMGITTVQNDQVKVTLDSLNFIVAINNPDLNLDQKEALDNYSKSKEMVQFLTKSNSREATIYRLTYLKSSPIKSVDIAMSNRKELLSITVFYAEPKEYEDENGEKKKDYIKLKIEYTNYSATINKKELAISTILNGSVKNYQLQKNFQNFELIDFRLPNTY